MASKARCPFSVGGLMFKARKSYMPNWSDYLQKAEKDIGNFYPSLWYIYDLWD
jgi:hypothetical protein